MFYLTGHFLSYIGSHIEPEHRRKAGAWYGFLQFREQFRLAAIIGILGTLLSISSYYLPVLLVFASWLFLIGNSIKSIGEYHKLNSPPTADTFFSTSRQNSLFLHSACNCLISIVSAIATTLVFFFPGASFSIMGVATLITIGIGAVSLQLWLDSHFGEHPKPCDLNSYALMYNTMGSKLRIAINPSITPIPTRSLQSVTNSTPSVPQDVGPGKLNRQDTQFNHSDKVKLFNNNANNFSCTLLR